MTSREYTLSLYLYRLVRLRRVLVSRQKAGLAAWRVISSWLHGGVVGGVCYEVVALYFNEITQISLYLKF